MEKKRSDYENFMMQNLCGKLKVYNQMNKMCMSFIFHYLQETYVDRPYQRHCL